VTETTLFMRIQNIKNGAQYTDGSFHYSLFFSPQPASATQLPTECICSNTINVTFADCLLAFYLNGNSALAAAATALSSCFAGVPLCTVPLHPVHFPSARIRGLPKQQPQLWQCDGVCICVYAPVYLWEDWEGHCKPSKRAFHVVKYFSFCLASLRLSSCQRNAKSFAAVMAPRGR